ncbi:unnamed protein product [Pleuronectes platessa]|uniref:Uncharacterized protein n=1 Tax=Pleuronectes platessa TaxID=8262 RepID=A0A9N7YN75_PLEPL|nr:unnamed protein product [Pleuronectes platessa]
MTGGVESQKTDRRIEGEVSARRWGGVLRALGIPVWGWYMQGRGREVRVSECQFNLIGVHPCRGSWKSMQRSNSDLHKLSAGGKRGEDRQEKIYGRVCGM